MSRLLLDTCTFVWLVAEPERISAKVKRAIDSEADLVLSDATVWEICLKWKAGKLQLPAPPRRWTEEQAATWSLSRVPLAADDLYRTTELPDLHRDPFDRLLVAQAMARDLTIATPDEAVRAYPVPTIW